MSEPGGETPSAGDDQDGEDLHGAQGLLATTIARPVTVMVGVILVAVFGALSVVGLPIQLTPDVTRPIMTIGTSWPGAAPTEIESEILEPQEDALEDVDGLVEMTSTASQGSGNVTLEFEVGTDIDEALVRVSNRLAQVGTYPEAANEPVVGTSDATGPPLAVITIRVPLEPDGSVPEATPAAYRTWLEQEILPELERIPGVGGVRHIGGRDAEVHVDFDAGALAARGLSVASLAASVRSELRDRSGGDLRIGKRSFVVRTPLVPEDVAELERIVIGAGPDGVPIRLADVGRVRNGLREARGVAFSDDRPSMVLLLTREAGTNVLEVTREVRDRVETLNTERFAPEGLEIEVISDQTHYIEGALELVQQNLLMGALLAIFALVVFLRSFGAALVISVSIPVCVFGTALGMSLLGRSVNVVSLAGVTFAIGMVLDNSIVSLESIDTWRRRAKTAAAAALGGVREVWGAVLASTATTAAVFVPIVLWEGEVGQLLRDVAIAIALAVAFSLLVSVWVIPSLAARFLKPKPPREGADPWSVRTGLRVKTWIGARVRWLSGRTHRALAIVALAVAGSIALALTLLPPLEYLPRGNRNLVFGILVPPPGYAVEELEAIGERVQAQMAAESGEGGVIARSFFVGSPDRVFAGCVAQDPDAVDAALAIVRRVQSGIPGVISFSNQASLFGGLGGGRSIEIDLSGSDLEVLTGLAGRMMGAVGETLEGAQTRPIPGLDPGAPELHVVPRREAAAGLRMAGDELGLTVDALVDGAIIGEVGPSGEPKLDVVLRGHPGDLDANGYEEPQALLGAPVATPSGHVVPLAALATLEHALGPTQIRRIERRRAITLQVSPPDEIPLEVAIDRIEREVVAPLEQEGAIPSDVRVDLSGTAADLDVATGKLIEVLLLALLISFLLLAALFEDFLAPVVVLASVPLAAAGGVGGLRLVDAFLSPQPLDLMTALGFLILIGVVVNNAILVVDGAIARLREGASLQDAVPAAVEARVRPIFMTTVTSLAGLLPMVLFGGAGAELYRGVGAIVLGGLALSSLLTLFVVPSVFTLVWRLRAPVSAAPADR